MRIGLVFILLLTVLIYALAIEARKHQRHANTDDSNSLMPNEFRAKNSDNDPNDSQETIKRKGSKKIRRQYNPQVGSYSQTQNGYGNGYANGNGYSNGYSNGNGLNNGYSNGLNNGYMNGYQNMNGNGGGIYGNVANVNNLNPRLSRNRLINIADNWEKIPYIFQTYNEPDQWYMMPMLSNGYIGTTVKNDSLYVMGLYNGLNGKSHRVRIPSLTAVEAYFPIFEENDVITYHFDSRRGIYTIVSRNNLAEIQQRFYVHRRMRNIIVNEIRVELLQRTSVVVELYNETKMHLHMGYYNQVNGYAYYYQDRNPENITYEQRVIRQPTIINKRTELNDGCYYLQATIPQTEIANKRQKQIHIYYTNVPGRFTVYNNVTVQYFHLIQSVDSDNLRAKQAYDDAIRMLSQDPQSLYVQHVSGWEEIWQKAGMAAVAEQTYSDSNQEMFKVAQRLYSSFYNIYASLPFTYDNQFYGLSPNGLSYGGLKYEYFNNTILTPSVNRPQSDGYSGHVLYHQELFMLPLMSMFNQDMSRSIIASRLRRGLHTDHMNIYDQARELAKQEGGKGLRYPWEQGDYGVDVSPFQDMRRSKFHVSADISFGMRSYLRVTHSREFLLQSLSSDVNVRGEDYLNEVAQYWNDKFKVDSISNSYEIKAVSYGERSQTREVNNDAFTNYVGSLAMDTYKYALELSDKNPYDSQYSTTVREYEEKISRVKIPFDTSRQLYLEYDGFTTGQQNEETWVPYLNYPLTKAMSYQEKKNIYDSYANQLVTDGRNMPAFMSFVVGYSELNEDTKAREYLSRMGTYFNGPFLVASEFLQQSSLLNPQNTFNFLPAYAAYATAFIAGFCGIRYRDFQLDLVYPSENFNQYATSQINTQYTVFKPPATQTENFNVTGLMYRGNKLDIIYNLRAKSVEIRNRRSSDQFVVADDTLEIVTYEGSEPVTRQLRVGDTVTVSLSSELWVYGPKKQKLQRRTELAENMHILASIYSTQQTRRVIRPTNSAQIVKMNWITGLILSIFVILFSKLF